MATGTTRAVKKAALEKQKATCANRLIPRLSAYLFGTDVYDKQKVRAILRKGGYKGPGWKDEARAVKILTDAGHDMSKFEWQTGRKPQKRYALANFDSPTPVTVTVPDAAIEKLKSTTIVLMQAEREIIKEFRDGRRKSLGGLVTTVSAALDEVRR